MSALVLTPDSLLDVTIRLGRPFVHYTAAPTILQVLIETRPNARTQHVAPPADIRLVVDTSGSMNEAAAPGAAAPSKLTVVKTAIHKLLEELTDRDSVHLSVFSTDGRLIVPQTLMTYHDRLRTMSNVDVLYADGGTNISAGLELALTPSVVPGALPRVVLFTDGQSSDPSTDHLKIVQLADLARTKDIPLFIYGTGSYYNASLLLQVAIRAGGVSFCKHVLDVAGLEGHLLAELAFLRGTAIERFEIEGVAGNDVALVSAKSMMPEIKDLKVANTKTFRDRTGSLDLHRGAQYLFELMVDKPSLGQMGVLSLTLRGRNRTTHQSFVQAIEIPVTFVADPAQQSPVDEQVHKVLILLAAAKMAEEGRYKAASGLYTRAGDTDTARAMDALHTASVRTGADKVDLGRSASTLARSTVVGTYTIVNSDKRSKS